MFGPLAIVLTLRRRGLNWAGEVYHWAIALVCLTALVMVPYDWARLWFFWPISIASYLFVYLGQRAAEAPGGLWYRGVLRGYGGGWIALWTAIVDGQPAAPAVGVGDPDRGRLGRDRVALLQAVAELDP